MFFKGKRARRRAEELIGLIYAAPAAPLAEMQELIELCRRHATATVLLIEHLAALLTEGGNDLGVCRLLLVIGEVGREGVAMMLCAVGRGDDPEVLQQVAVPVEHGEDSG